ncbi:MAG: hypothetical protein QM674_04795 [Burkholderiaceae bacterium]
MEWGLAFGGLLMLGLIAYLLRQSTKYRNWLQTGGGRYLPALGWIIASGLLLRVIWILAFPAMPASDGASYIKLAQGLLSDGQYITAGTRAYWPPGYPIFLMPWLAIFPVKWAIPISQLALSAIGAWGCYRLASRLSGETAGRLAALLFCFWPNLVMLSGVPEKEYVILAILPWVTLGLLGQSILRQLIAGLGLGCCILVQPSLQLLLPVVLIGLLLFRQNRALLRGICVVLAAACVIAPWTLRNMEIFDQFVLISTNGGSNLYRANNPLADGGYTERGEVDVSHLDELAQDRVSRKLAMEWISTHPLSFLRLAVEKQIRFMGDDAYGTYATLRTGRASESTAVYIVFKSISNSFWLLFWLVSAALSFKKSGMAQGFQYLIVGWLYLFGLHSIFEAEGRYHVPMLWILCVWLACALQPVRLHS